MIIEVKVPPLPESVSEASLTVWSKKAGEFVERDENLVELETDKVALELPAPQSGVIVDIVEPDGASVTAGQLIARIDTTATAAKAMASPAAVAEDMPAKTAPAMPEPPVVVMPAAAVLAAEKNIDLARIRGSGRDGRILKEDVQNAVGKPAPSTSPSPSNPLPIGGFLESTPPVSGLSPFMDDRPEQRVPMTRLRQRVAERLLLSQQTNAILTTFNEVNMKPVMDLRMKYREKFEQEYGVRLGFMSFFVKAVVLALKKFPMLNASIDASDIVYHGYFDIGVAVGSPRGLVVPILRNADQLSLAEIEKQIADFGKRAQNGKLSVEEMIGGTYTISNGGSFGSMMSTPIINPPQSAILGMHSIKDRPIIEDGQIVARPMMYLAQSYDHRLIDGREAVMSLVTIKDAIEDPSRLILEL